MNLKNSKDYKQYRIIYVNRLTGHQETSETLVHLEEKEVINWQIERSTIKTIVMLKEVI